jgi:hypothetical protein
MDFWKDLGLLSGERTGGSKDEGILVNSPFGQGLVRKPPNHWPCFYYHRSASDSHRLGLLDCVCVCVCVRVCVSS